MLKRLSSLCVALLVFAAVPDAGAVSEEDVRRASLEPVAAPDTFIAQELEKTGGKGPVAVLPEGPMTIPYLR